MNINKKKKSLDKQRDRGRAVVVCLTVHWPCNSPFILRRLQMGFYTPCFYLQIKQCVVVAKPVKRQSKAIFPARSPSSQTTQQSIKPVLVPESDRLLSLSQQAVCSPLVSLSASFPRLAHSEHRQKSAEEKPCKRERQRFSRIQPFISNEVLGHAESRSGK